MDQEPHGLKVLDFPAKEKEKATAADALREMARSIDDGKLPPIRNIMLVLRCEDGRLIPYAAGEVAMCVFEASGVLHAAAQMMVSAHVAVAPPPTTPPPPAR